jgi:hypothetical protein
MVKKRQNGLMMLVYFFLPANISNSYPVSTVTAIDDQGGCGGEGKWERFSLSQSHSLPNGKHTRSSLAQANGSSVCVRHCTCFEVLSPPQRIDYLSSFLPFFSSFFYFIFFCFCFCFSVN